MNKLAKNLLTLMLVGSVLLVYGCESDDSEGTISRPSATNWRDLVVTLNNMDSHLGQMIAFRVVSKLDPEKTTVFDELRAVARIDSLHTTPFTFTIPLAVPEGVHRLDFWCDENGNSWYDPSLFATPTVPSRMNDHAYRILLPATGTATVSVTHPDAAADTMGAYQNNVWVLDVNQEAWLRSPSHLWMNLSGMTTAVDHALELIVYEPISGRALGFYRFSRVDAGSFQIVLPNIAGLNDDGTGEQIKIDFYVDMDDSGTYNTGDDSWSVTGTVNTFNDTLGAGVIIPVADSLVVDFAYSTNFTTIIWP